MLLCNAAGEKCPKVADNFFITVIKNYPKVGNNSSKINVNKNCLQDIFCVCDYVAVSRCFCYGVQLHINSKIYFKIYYTLLINDYTNKNYLYSSSLFSHLLLFAFNIQQSQHDNVQKIYEIKIDSEDTVRYSQCLSVKPLFLCKTI